MRSKVRAIYYGDKQIRALSKDAVLAFMLRLVGAALGFAVNVVLARMLGVEGAGLYFLSLTVVTVVTVLGMFGLGTTGLRFVAASSGEGNMGRAKNVSVVVTSLAVTILACCSVLSLYLSERVALGLFSNQELVRLIFWMSLGIVPFGFLQLMAEQLRGVGKIAPALSMQGVYLPLITVWALIVFSLWCSGGVWSFYWLVRSLR
jgi:O-antigen/teichoic acid export membrane protein